MGEDDKSSLERIKEVGQNREQLFKVETNWADLLRTATSEGTIKLEDKIRDFEYMFVDELTWRGREVLQLTRSGKAVLGVNTLYNSDGRDRPTVEVFKFLLDEPENLETAIKRMDNTGEMPVFVDATLMGIDENRRKKVVNIHKLSPEDQEEFDKELKKEREANPDYPVNPDKLDEWEEEFRPAKQKLVEEAQRKTA